jgi:hypothetical protein
MNYQNLVGVQKVRWEGGDTETAEEYTFFMERERES